MRISEITDKQLSLLSSAQHQADERRATIIIQLAGWLRKESLR
jgi:hypothetical protein